MSSFASQVPSPRASPSPAMTGSPSADTTLTGPTTIEAAAATISTPGSAESSSSSSHFPSASTSSFHTLSSPPSIPISQWTQNANHLQMNHNNNPLVIPEILELVLLHVLAQFQGVSTDHSYHPFTTSSCSASSVSASSASAIVAAANNADIQRQVRAQRPMPTRLAFLRVCRLWYQVGEPLMGRDIRWSDCQSPEVHQQIWSRWRSVRSFTFEYGKRTTDTEVPAAASTMVASISTSPSTSTSVTAVTAATASSSSSALMPPPPTSSSSSSSSMGWANGPRARMRNFLGGDNTHASSARSSSPSSQTVRAGTRARRAGSEETSAMSATGGVAAGSSNGLQGVDHGASPHLSGRPRLTLDQALDQLARAMSQPSHQPHYRPAPLPLRGIQYHNQLPQLVLPPLGLGHDGGLSSLPPASTIVPYLHRSQLTSLTLTGLFRLETFLETILPFVPELTYLDICLRCWEWRDEIRLDKVLRTCPKLQYLSVDRNMIGRVDFDDPSETGDTDDDDSNDDNDDNDSGDDGAVGEDGDATESERSAKDVAYVGIPWHLPYTHAWSRERKNAPGEKILDPKRPSGHRKSDRPRKQRPLALRVLKLKKVRMMEQEFVRLLKLCPLLEEMDVFSTTYWDWNRTFLHTVAQSCPRIRHLHLTTNYITGENIAGGPTPGITLRETPYGPPPAHIPGTAMGTTIAMTNAGSGSGSTGPTIATPDISTAGFATVGQESSILTSAPPPYDPVVELIRLFPALRSYDARYVRFQDRTLMALQQTCRHLEHLDLTSCREVSSKAVDWFLRHMPTLRHFSASQTVLRIEDLIESAREYDRAMAAAAANAAARKRRMCQEELSSSSEDDTMEFEETSLSLPPRWWVCDRLETFIIGVKNPTPPGHHNEFDLHAQRVADFQFYYRDQQGASSSSSSSSSAAASIATVSGSSGSDYIQYCTFTLFEQLGRLRRLKRLELHGGRFDLGVQLPLLASNHSLGMSETLSADEGSSSDWLSHQHQEPKSGSKALRGLSKMRSFLSVVGKGKGKATEGPSPQEFKGKGKAKAKGKGKYVERYGDVGATEWMSGTGYDPYATTTTTTAADGIPIEQEDMTNDMSHHYYHDHHHPHHGYGNNNNNNNDNSTNNNRSLVNSQRSVPRHLTGLQPLAGLKQLESFSMTWSNFPMLREQDIAWICQHWTSLEWISLGLVPDDEWDRIRSWVRSRRSDIIVVFER
ncbi:MAG: hypothetical protein J3Q66DRAFT_40594 [Benniella sp.]|nr:MAG: hypothetical protein J3Q66DRAFT_40594 [Benniella sp.]